VGVCVCVLFCVCVRVCCALVKNGRLRVNCRCSLYSVRNLRIVFGCISHESGEDTTTVAGETIASHLNQEKEILLDETSSLSDKNAVV
jgi:hypothetical protein